MQIDTVDLVGRWSFYIGVAAILSIIAHGMLLVFFHFLMPRAVLEKYFKPPYFRQFECVLFSGIPYAPIRTVMFMRAIAFPGSGKRRGITGAHLLVPHWYRLVSKIMITVGVGNMFALLLFLIGSGLVYLNRS